jgi:hypothetical protein
VNTKQRIERQEERANQRDKYDSDRETARAAYDAEVRQEKLALQPKTPAQERYVPGGSVRDREARQRLEAADDVLDRSHVSNSRDTGVVPRITSVRDRQNAAASLAQDAKDNPTQMPNAAAEAGLAMYAQQQRWKQDDEQKNRDAIKRNEDAVRLEAQQQQAQKDARLRDKLLAVCYEDMGASAMERSIVDGLVRQKYPTRFGDMDLHKATLMKLRAECGTI